MKYIILLLLIVSLFAVHPTIAASAGDDPTPTGSGGGGGGGSPQYYDYYVPLVFGPSHRDGYSEVTVWFLQGGQLFTDFAIDDLGRTSLNVQEPTKFTFNPVVNKGLTNGSLIRTTTPVLVTGMRNNEDIFNDTSFAYSILIDRMMGFEYTSPVNGWINLLSLSPQTTVNIENLDGKTTSYTITQPRTTGSFPVKIGDTINSTYPTNGAFISYDNGTSASMAVPSYLRGDQYIFDLNSNAPTSSEIDRSFLQIIPSQPTHLTLIYSDISPVEMDIFGTTTLNASDNLRGIISSRGLITVSLHQKVDYGARTRQSLVQFIDSSEMRSGELFITPAGFSSQMVSLHDNTVYNSGYYNQSLANYALTSKLNITRDLYEKISFVGLTDSTFLFGSDSSFGYLSSPGRVGNPMSPSLLFLNLPLNPSTYRANVTGLQSTWFRFPDLALQSISIEPGPPEQYTGQTIRVVFISNGSLPASRFRVEVTIDGQTVTDKTYDYLGVNRTLDFKYSRFISFGAKAINITARIDVENTVNEINENDNSGQLNEPVNRNFRLEVTFIGLSLLILILIVLKIRTKIKRNSDLKRSHVDAIITDITEENG